MLNNTRWEEVAALSQVLVGAICIASKCSDIDEEAAVWFVDGDGVDFPGLTYFLAYGEKVGA